MSSMSQGSLMCLSTASMTPLQSCTRSRKKASSLARVESGKQMAFGLMSDTDDFTIPGCDRGCGGDKRRKDPGECKNARCNESRGE